MQKVSLEKIYADFAEAAKVEMDRLYLILERAINMAVDAGADITEAGEQIMQIYIAAVSKSMEEFVQKIEAS